MIDLELLNKIKSKDESITEEEVGKALAIIEKDGESGSTELLDAYISICPIVYERFNSYTEDLHRLNQYYIINVQTKMEVPPTPNQMAVLYINNIEYYYSMNLFSESAKNANWVLELPDVDNELRMTAISYLLVLVKNPQLKEEEEYYVEKFKNYEKNNSTSIEFRILVYMSLFDRYCLARDREGYLKIKAECMALACKTIDESVLKRLAYRLLVCDEIVSDKAPNANIISEIMTRIENTPRDRRMLDSIAGITVELCRKLQHYFNEGQIVAFLGALVGRAPNINERLCILEYLVDELKIRKEKFYALHQMYYDDLKEFRNNFKRLSVLELKNEIVFYRRYAMTIDKRRSDELTGLLNRNQYEELLDNYPEELESELSVVMGDVNYLKATNDTYGHKAGDYLLVSLAEMFRNTFSPYGSCYRIGGDEFVAVIKTDTPQVLLDDLKARLLKTKGPDGNPFSISFGLASAKNLSDLSLAELVNVADQRMYKEKEKVHKKKYLKQAV